MAEFTEEQLNKYFRNLVGPRSLQDKFQRMSDVKADPMESLEKLDDAVEYGTTSFRKITRGFLDLLSLPKSTKTVFAELSDQLKVFGGSFKDEQNKLRQSILKQVKQNGVFSEAVKKQAEIFSISRKKLDIFYEGLEDVLDKKRKLENVPKLQISQIQKKSILQAKLDSITSSGPTALSESDKQEKNRLEKKIEAIEKSIKDYATTHEMANSDFEDSLIDFEPMIKDIQESIDDFSKTVNDPELQDELDKFKINLQNTIEGLKNGSKTVASLFETGGVFDKLKMYSVLVQDAGNTIKTASEKHAQEMKENTDKLVAGITAATLALGKTVEMAGTQYLSKLGAGLGGDFTDSYFIQAASLGVSTEELIGAVKDNQLAMRAFGGQDTAKALDEDIMNSLKDGGRVLGKIGAEAIVTQLKNIDMSLSMGSYQGLQTPEQRAESAAKMSKIFTENAKTLNQDVATFMGDFGADLDSGALGPMIKSLRMQGLSGDRLTEALISNYGASRRVAQELGINSDVHRSILQQSLNTRHQGIAEAIKGQVSTDILITQLRSMGINISEAEEQAIKKYQIAGAEPGTPEYDSIMQIMTRIVGNEEAIQARAQSARSVEEARAIMAPLNAMNTFMGSFGGNFLEKAREQRSAQRAETLAEVKSQTGEFPVTTTDPNIIRRSTEVDNTTGVFISLQEAINGLIKNPLGALAVGFAGLAIQSMIMAGMMKLFNAGVATTLLGGMRGAASGARGALTMGAQAWKSAAPWKKGLIIGAGTVIGGMLMSGSADASNPSEFSSQIPSGVNPNISEIDLEMIKRMELGQISQDDINSLINYQQTLLQPQSTSNTSNITDLQNYISNASTGAMIGTGLLSLFSGPKNIPPATSMLGKTGQFFKGALPAHIAMSGFTTAADIAQTNTGDIAKRLGISYSSKEEGSGWMNALLGAEEDDSLAMQTYKDLWIRTIGSFQSLSDDLTFGLFDLETPTTPTKVEQAVEEATKKQEKEQAKEEYISKLFDTIPPERLAEILINLEQANMKIATNTDKNIEQQKLADLKDQEKTYLAQQAANALNEDNFRKQIGNIEKRVANGKLMAGFS